MTKARHHGYRVRHLGRHFVPVKDVLGTAPPDHPLCQHTQLNLQDLTAFPLLTREPGSGTRQACEEYFHLKRAHFAHSLEVGSLESQREGVLAGLGVALLPRHAVRRELDIGVLCELPVAELPLLRSWCLVHPRGKYLSPVAQAFFAFVRDQRSLINALAERFAAPAPACSPGS